MRRFGIGNECFDPSINKSLNHSKTLSVLVSGLDIHQVVFVTCKEIGLYK